MPGAAFRNPRKPDLPCPSGFLLHGLVTGRVSCVGSWHCVPCGLEHFSKDGDRQNRELDLGDIEGVESIGFGSLLDDNNNK